MINRAQADQRNGNFADWELAAIGASLTECDSDAVCQVAMAVIVHTPSGQHEVRIATSIVNDPKATAAVLRHAADHTHGGCKRCARRAREGGHRAGA
jgi:H2-forming N5,N10-methylenetetrahydromethanopterin dehydrogenase-like enzyme